MQKKNLVSDFAQIFTRVFEKTKKRIIQYSRSYYKKQL